MNDQPTLPANPLTVLPPVDQGAHLPAFLAGVPQGQIWLSWDPETDADKIAVLNAKGAAAEQLADLVGALKVGETIKLKVDRALIHPWEQLPDDKGEVKTLIRCVLITPDGKCYAASSPIIRDLVLLAQTILGHGRWPGGLPVEIGRKPGKVKGWTYTYKVDPTYSRNGTPALPGKEPKGGKQ